VANLMQFSVTEGAAAEVTVADVVIAGRIEDDQGNVMADYTGAAAQHFPACLAALTPEQRQTLYDQIAATVLYMRAGMQ